MAEEFLIPTAEAIPSINPFFRPPSSMFAATYRYSWPVRCYARQQKGCGGTQKICPDGSFPIRSNKRLAPLLDPQKSILRSAKPARRHLQPSPLSLGSHPESRQLYPPHPEEKEPIKSTKLSVKSVMAYPLLFFFYFKLKKRLIPLDLTAHFDHFLRSK